MTDIIIIILLVLIWLDNSMFGKWLYGKLRHNKIMLKRWIKRTLKF